LRPCSCQLELLIRLGNPASPPGPSGWGLSLATEKAKALSADLLSDGDAMAAIRSGLEGFSALFVTMVAAEMAAAQVLSAELQIY